MQVEVMKTLLTPSHSIGPSVEGSIIGFSPGIIGTETTITSMN